MTASARKSLLSGQTSQDSETLGDEIACVSNSYRKQYLLAVSL